MNGELARFSRRDCRLTAWLTWKATSKSICESFAGKLAKKPPTEAALTGLPFEHRHFNLVGQDCEMTCEAVE
jgi:hypothetical protein